MRVPLTPHTIGEQMPRKKPVLPDEYVDQETDFRYSAAEFLRGLRVQAGISREDAAKAVNINLSTLSRYENGNRACTAFELFLFCRMYHGNPNDLFNIAEEACRTPSVSGIMDEIRDLSEEERDMLLEMIRLYKKKRK